MNKEEVSKVAEACVATFGYTKRVLGQFHFLITICFISVLINVGIQQYILLTTPPPKQPKILIDGVRLSEGVVAKALAKGYMVRALVQDMDDSQYNYFENIWIDELPSRIDVIDITIDNRSKDL